MNRYAKIVVVLSLMMGGSAGLLFAEAEKETLFDESIRSTTEALGPPNAILIDKLFFAGCILLAVLSLLSIGLLVKHWRKW